MELGERKHLIRDHLIHTREELLDVIGQMQPSDWERPVQAVEGGWKVKQVLLHLATSESGQIKLGQAIAAGQPAVPDDFDLNRYNLRSTLPVKFTNDPTGAPNHCCDSNSLLPG